MAESEPPTGSQDKQAARNTVDEKLKKRDRRKSADDVLKIKRYNDQNIDDMRIVELKDALRQLDAATTGNKAELQMRLRHALARERRKEGAGAFDKDAATDDEEISDDDEEATSDSEEDVAIEERKERNASKNQRVKRETCGATRDKAKDRRTRAKKEHRRRGETSDIDTSDTDASDSDTSGERASDGRNQRSTLGNNRRYRRNAFTIKDVEGSLTYFTGDDKLPIEKWIAEFEDTSDLLQWDELQRLIYGKRMLKGSAKRFISFEKNITSWKTLKRKLNKEFKTELNSALIHSKLFKRRRQQGESSRQYIYAMQEIADQGYIEEEALVQYIIDGLPDEDGNKTFLYEACTIRGLKKKLEVYDRLKEKTQRKRTSLKKDKDNLRNNVKETKREPSKAGSRQTDKKHCFNCGSAEHDVKSCTNADKGPKCFKCNCFGHIASKCDAKQTPSSETTPVTVSCVNSMSNKFIPVNIAGAKYQALLDTGSDVSLIRDDLYRSVGKPKLNKTMRVFTGLGNVTTKPSGTFRLKLSVEEEDYEVEIFVVPTRSMTSEIILGRDFMQDVEVVIKRGHIGIKRLTAGECTAKEIGELVHHGEEDAEDEGFKELTVLSCTVADEIEAPEQYRSQIETMIAEYRPRKDVKTPVETKIVLKDETPVNHRLRRLAPKEKKILDEQISEWLQSGIVKPSQSEYASPVVIVRKKDGSSRVCVDYRSLNKKIIRDRYPMPLIDDQIDALMPFRVFSVLDLKNGFFHVPVNKDNQKYTAFVTPTGQYEFTRTPFGLCNSPTNFLRFVSEVFRELTQRSIVFTYMDDLIVPVPMRQKLFPG